MKVECWSMAVGTGQVRPGRVGVCPNKDDDDDDDDDG